VYGYRCEVVLTCFVHSRQRELVLAFSIVDVAESGTVTCVIREAGEAGNTVPLVYHLGLGQAEAEVVEASAGEIAASLAEYAKGKDGKLYSDAMLEILHP
jgi:hypothetical protein